MSDREREPLIERVNRAKARWLKRVMYESPANSTEKCLAYAVADYLNCVTLDAWPSLHTLSRRLGFMNVKTLHRAARGLEKKKLLTIERVDRTWRLAPVFMSSDEDKVVARAGQSRARSADKNVQESYLSIRLTESSSTGRPKEEKQGDDAYERFRRRRGEIEVKVAQLLGPDGIDVLWQLATIGDHVVDRLCRACHDGVLTDRELEAARLAAKYVRR